MTQAMIICEESFFPGEPLITLRHIDLNPTRQSLSCLVHDPTFTEWIPRLQEAWENLLKFADWMSSAYDSDVHDNVFEAITDTTLLLETAGMICRVDFLRPPGWGPTSMSFDAADAAPAHEGPVPVAAANPEIDPQADPVETLLPDSGSTP
eukprot:s3203_g1.t1